MIAPISHLRNVRGWLLCVLLWPAIGLTQPYTPHDDQLVLVDIPTEVQRLRSSQSTQIPLVQARPMAELLLRQYRQSGDPRQLGRAQALLQPWLDRPDTAPSTALLGAQLAQAGHDFGYAQELLMQVLQDEPNNLQAHLELANILRVQGQFAQAAEACAGLNGANITFVRAVCAHSMASLQGQLDPAWQQLNALRPQTITQPGALQSWYWSEWVDMALRRSDAASLEQAWSSTPGQQLRSGPLLYQYLDWLISQQQWQDILALTEPQNTKASTNPAIIVPRFLALHALKDPQARPVAEQLETLWRALQTRPTSQRHGREEARFWLAMGEAQKASTAAWSHWQNQREAADTLIFARAAVAANDDAALNQLRSWLQSTGYEDRRLPSRVQP